MTQSNYKFHKFTDRDWPEDFGSENGDYINRCGKCNSFFSGHKRRPFCKVCYDIAAMSEDQSFLNTPKKLPKEIRKKIRGDL